MNITELSMALAQIDVQSDVSVAMLSKAMDNNEVLGENMVEMLDAAAMENSVMPYLGGTMDVRI